MRDRFVLDAMAPTDPGHPTDGGRPGDVKRSASPWVLKAGPYSRHGSEFAAIRPRAPTGQVGEAGESRRKSHTSLGSRHACILPWQRTSPAPTPSIDWCGNEVGHPAIRTVARPRPSLIGFCHPTAATLGTQTKPGHQARKSLTVAVLPAAGGCILRPLCAGDARAQPQYQSTTDVAFPQLKAGVVGLAVLELVTSS
jgi:hypothetical protein